MLCCAGISRRNPFMDMTHKRTLNQDYLSVRRSRGHRYYVDEAEIINCDKVADNGVVHSINTIVMPPRMVQDGARTSGRRDFNRFLALMDF